MFRNRHLAVAVIGILTAALAAGPAVAGETETAEEMRHGIGTVVTYYEGGTLERAVEAWVASNGAYRVITVTLDGSRAAEEVVFDGKVQTAYVTDPGGSTSVIAGDFADHFAIQYEAPEPKAGEKLVTFELSAVGLAERVVREYASGSRVDLQIAWERVEYDSSLLEPDARRSLSLEVAALGRSPIRGTEATGSNSATFINILDATACVYAYNFRNTGTGYFRATSSSRNSCYYMDESLWKGSVGSSGSCSQLAFYGGGPTLPNFSSKYVYTSPANASPSCSNHAGWLSDWSLVTAWDGLNTSV